MEKEKEYFDYLELLRDSGVTNMIGAGLYLEATFDLSRSEARKVLVSWVESYKK